MSMKLATQLEPQALEKRFREAGLKRDIGVATALLSFAILFNLIAIPTDLQLIGESAILNMVWSLRVFSLVAAILTLFLIWPRRDIVFFDNIITAWAVLLLISVVAANAMFPRDYTEHVAWDVFFALGAYAVLPIPLSRQFLVAMIITVGDLLLFSQFKVLARTAAFPDILSAFFCANAVGFFVSWELNIWRRRQFTALIREAELTRELEQALLEVKTLKGIIPICANCKKVRTDEGLWRQVEAYVRDHSEAEFSHSVCPDCTKLLYPDLFEEGRS